MLRVPILLLALFSVVGFGQWLFRVRALKRSEWIYSDVQAAMDPVVKICGRCKIEGIFAKCLENIGHLSILVHVLPTWRMDVMNHVGSQEFQLLLSDLIAVNNSAIEIRSHSAWQLASDLIHPVQWQAPDSSHITIDRRNHKDTIASARARRQGPGVLRIAQESTKNSIKPLREKL